MLNRKMRLYLDLLDKYMDFANVYVYSINTITTYETRANYAEGVIVQITELCPNYFAGEGVPLVIEISRKGRDTKLSFRNSQLNDCVYDFLEENDLTVEKADAFMEECYQLIREYDEKYT